jgi:hypothetical protein
MAVRIFETDPDSKPKPKVTYASDMAFRFRSGMTDEDGKPVSLEHWRVTTPERSTGEAIAQLFGGKADEWETSKDDFIQVLTNANAVQVVVNGPQAIESRLILWGRNGPIHECDGVNFLSPEEDKGRPCGCPPLLADRKAQARSQRGPAPHTTIRFRLAEDLDLGEGSFSSTSWDLLTVLHEVENDLEAIGGEALCELRLELVEYTTKAGRHVMYRKPVLEVIKPWADAIAD